MADQSREDPFRLEFIGDLQPLRDAMISAGFVGGAVQATLTSSHSTEKKPDLVMLMRRTEEPNHYNTLFRLFVMECGTPESAVRSALPSCDVESLVAGGLLLRTAEGLRSSAKLLPYQRLYIASDFLAHQGEESLPTDLVLSVSNASMTLSALTVRRQVERALDVGCGGGILALLAASHAGHVVGTDINQRALGFARFNAKLNNITNTEWRSGSFFAPVEDELYDLVVSNPPFVVSPQSEFLFRDAGLGADKVSEFMVRKAPRMLREGGYACILINWCRPEQQEWAVRPTAWLEGNGCDSWLICCHDEDRLTYASTWLRETESDRPTRYAKLLDEWLDYYDRAGIDRICFGAVIMRRRSGRSNWLRCDEISTSQGTSDCGNHIERIFAAEDFLTSMASDEELLSQRLAAYPDVAFTQHLSLQDGAWNAVGLKIYVTRGLPFSGEADPLLFKLLGQLDGRKVMQDAVRQVAGELELDFGSLAPACLQIVKKLIRAGMLIPVAA
jgi:methylase of polypeptide subunit release factors